MRHKTKQIILLTMIVSAFVKPALARSYAIDPAQSQIAFSVSNFGVHHVTGRFEQFSGQLVYDSSDLAQARTEATIPTVSIDTKNSERDHHLRSADFFNAPVFPTITFVSQSIVAEGRHCRVTGLLTMKGISKTVSFLADVTEVVEPTGKTRFQAHVDTILDRRDFGITYGNAFMVGNMIRVT